MRPRLEVADVVRAHRERFLTYRRGRLASAERRVLDDIAACRTAARGGHVERCDRCGHERIAYNSCRNRHCPKCEGPAREAWLSARMDETLPVPYAHVVFTLPPAIGTLALHNRRRVYDILFRASAETLCEIAADPNHLGASIGFLSVLHTWGQTLQHHPHVHCLVPAGGLAPDGSRWIACRPGFFLPVLVLARMFRGKFLDHLVSAFDEGKLQFGGQLANLNDPTVFRSYLAPLYHHDWVVYVRPPFGTPRQVVEYLARYTHRVAISNSRLVAFHGDHVAFRWKDYRHGAKKKTMTLDAVQFLRRFLLHVLPKGFPRVRHYGFLANRSRKARLDLCRTVLAAPAADSVVASAPTIRGDDEVLRCSACRVGRLRFVALLPLGTSIVACSMPAHDTS